MQRKCQKCNALFTVRKDEKICQVVAWKKSNKPWLVTMRADDWFEIYRKWEAGKR